MVDTTKRPRPDHRRCYEHTLANLQSKHRKEGVAEDIQNCVRRYRGANGEGESKRGCGKGKRERDRARAGPVT